MRLLSVPTFLVAAGLASSASGQVLATDPEPAPPAATIAEPPPLPERPEVGPDQPEEATEEATIWYGDDLLIAGAVTSSVTMIGVSMFAIGEDDGELTRAGVTIASLGLLGHIISGPALHGAEAGGWRPWVSVAHRLGLGFGIPGIAAGICGAQSGCDNPGAILAATFAAGVLLPVAIDAAIAWRPPTPKERRDLAIAPYAAPRLDGATAGVAGRF